MTNAKKKFLFSILAVALCATTWLLLFCGTPAQAKADNVNNTVYCNDSYAGTGTSVWTSYDIYYDYYTPTAQATHKSVPSFGKTDNSMKNACGAYAGMNIAAFYDRWYTNLIPNYEPGVLFGNGNYEYYSFSNSDAATSKLKEIYSLMKIEEVGGTTSANFKSGLDQFVKNAGYKLSSTSFYKNSKTVDLDKLAQAINNNKVGLLMLSGYNLIYDITDATSPTRTRITKCDVDAGHMVMVYGFVTRAYYKDGVNFKTETYLRVNLGDGSSDTGYIKTDDYLHIDEALIYTIY